MGIGFTIDSAIKVAPLGISSVMSLVDDMLMEKMREFHSREFELPFNPISVKVEDFRAKRITAYLNMVDNIVKNKFEKIKSTINEKGKEFEKFMDLLPDYSTLKQEFHEMIQNNASVKSLKEWADKNINHGSIDVNIMTKLDKVNYKGGQELPIEHNDAFAALRGFANSTVNSSIVFSAGMSPKLYSYIENFEDFFPDAVNNIKKKIILKVSDVRSAMVQGQMLAKKGLWVSEYRIESGLNCGGHAFATEGMLMGPILETFKSNYKSLKEKAHQTLVSALQAKGKPYPEEPMELRVTAQGGVGTAEEHDFLLDEYNLDSVGWGSPFLLVPEASTMDDKSIELLANAKEEDLYLSDISPLGVKFNSIKGNTKDLEKQMLIDIDKPGSNCPKRYLVSNKDYTDRAVCTASRVYQKKKIQELDLKRLPKAEHQLQYNKIVEKSCICVGLGTTALVANKLDTKIEGPGVSICPGPNAAYFDKKLSLKEMVSHIYGKSNVISHPKRPHVFVKELGMYVDHFKEKIESFEWPLNKAELKFIKTYESNMREGISYYKNLFGSYKKRFQDIKLNILDDLKRLENEFESLTDKKESISKETSKILNS
jgi:hypothetical protein